MDPREYDWSVTAKTAAGKLLVISGLVADHEQQAPVTAEELNATVGLLREFAATWNSGIADTKGKTPNPIAQPCEYLIVIARGHDSKSDQTIHTSVKVASLVSWTNGGRAVHMIHVYDGTEYWQHTPRIKPARNIGERAILALKNDVTALLAPEYQADEATAFKDGITRDDAVKVIASVKCVSEETDD
jgi:hypothetical protein